MEWRVGGTGISLSPELEVGTGGRLVSRVGGAGDGTTEVSCREAEASDGVDVEVEAGEGAGGTDSVRGSTCFGEGDTVWGDWVRWAGWEG